MKLLVVGVHTRPAVVSAKGLGYEVFSVDYFGSKDIMEAADLSRSIIQQRPYESMGRFSDNYSDEGLRSLAKDIEADGVILTSTLEFKAGNVIGTKPSRVMKVKNKWYQYNKIKGKGLALPETRLANTREEALAAASDLGYPVVIKPVTGGGGKKVHLIRDEKDIPMGFEKPHLVQEFIEGVPISISTLSTGKDVKVLSTSHQTLGSKGLNQEGFTYCGNIVPYDMPLDDDLLAEMEEITRIFRVKGWTGIDLVLGEKPYFIEMNPRFQGSFDCVERAYGINLVDAHMQACAGELVHVPAPRRFSTRMIFFAKNRSIVRDNSYLNYDIPRKNVIIEKGEPVTSVVTSAGYKKSSIRLAESAVRGVKRSIHKV